MGIKLRPGRTDSRGAGHYWGSDGKHYYGTPSNGYLTEVKEQTYSEPEKRKSAPQQTTKSNSKNTGSSLATAVGFVGGAALMHLLSKYGVKIAKVLGILFIVAVGLIGILINQVGAVNREARADEYDLDIYVNVREFGGREEDGRQVWLVTVNGTLTNRTADYWRNLTLYYRLINPDGSYVKQDGKTHIITTTKYAVASGETIELTSIGYNPISYDAPTYNVELVKIELRAPRYDEDGLLSEEQLQEKAEMFAEAARQAELQIFSCPECGLDVPKEVLEELGFCEECEFLYAVEE